MTVSRRPPSFVRPAAVVAAVALALGSGACARAAQTGDHAGHVGPAADGSAAQQGGITAGRAGGLPASAATAKARLAASPRHREWVMIRGGDGDSVGAWVIYPERRDNAPVVVVVHEIFGVAPWIQAVADQLAAEGFIAIAPDFLTGMGVPAGEDSAAQSATIRAIRSLDPQQVQRRLAMAGNYGMSLPAATRKYGVVGFCWGGSTVFQHAVFAPDLDASVVYYGTSPREGYDAIRAPVLGLYGQDDARVNATVPAADSAMKRLGKPFEAKFYEGAGHGFLRQQEERGGANLAATRDAWPRTIAFFKQHLGS